MPLKLWQCPEVDNVIRYVVFNGAIYGSIHQSPGEVIVGCWRSKHVDVVMGGSGGRSSAAGLE